MSAARASGWNPKMVANAAFAVVFFALAGWRTWAAMDFIATSETAPGRVVALNAGPHHPQVRFATRDGQVISYPQGGLVSARLGEAVVVRYDPRDPERTASLDRWPALWDVPMFFALFGVAWTLGVWQARHDPEIRGGRWG